MVQETHAMTPEAQRIAIAEACGWSIVKNYGKGGLYGYPRRTPSYDIAECPPGAVPDYPGDLNAMHEAEKVLTEDQHARFRSLVMYDGNSKFANYHLGVSATAAQRAEAFLRTIGKWDDSK